MLVRVLGLGGGDGVGWMLASSCLGGKLYVGWVEWMLAFLHLDLVRVLLRWVLWMLGFLHLHLIRVFWGVGRVDVSVFSPGSNTCFLGVGRVDVSVSLPGSDTRTSLDWVGWMSASLVRVLSGWVGWMLASL